MANPTPRAGFRPTTRCRWSSIHCFWPTSSKTGCLPIALRLSPGTQSLTLQSPIARQHSELAADAPNGALYAETLTIGLALHLLANYGVAKPKMPAPRGKLTSFQLRSVVDFICSQLDRQLSLVTLARCARISPFHFARLFRATLGLPPHQFVLRLRLQRATRLIEARQLTLAEIAIECGFHDQPHLTRTFHKVFRMTPAMYQRTR